jgi:hypothetical protein
MCGASLAGMCPMRKSGLAMSGFVVVLLLLLLLL